MIDITAMVLSKHLSPSVYSAVISFFARFAKNVKKVRADSWRKMFMDAHMSEYSTQFIAYGVISWLSRNRISCVIAKIKTHVFTFLNSTRSRWQPYFFT